MHLSLSHHRCDTEWVWQLRNTPWWGLSLSKKVSALFWICQPQGRAYILALVFWEYFFIQQIGISQMWLTQAFRVGRWVQITGGALNAMLCVRRGRWMFSHRRRRGNTSTGKGLKRCCHGPAGAWGHQMLRELATFSSLILSTLTDSGALNPTALKD